MYGMISRGMVSMILVMFVCAFAVMAHMNSVAIKINVLIFEVYLFFYVSLFGLAILHFYFDTANEFAL